MRVIISGGGTGGHIYPAIAIASKIEKNDKQAKILFIGTKSGLESDIVPKAGFDIETITVSYLKRKISIHNLKSAGMLLKGLWEARKIIRRFKPDIVVGTGGFVCGPIVFMAARMGIPTIIHEQNVFPGITNKILSNFVDKVAVSFDEASKYFKRKDKLVLTGNPIRDDFFHVSPEEAEKRYVTTKEMPLVMIVGGSGGSIRINETVTDMMIKYPNKSFAILLVTGKRHHSKIMAEISQHGIDMTNDRVLPYIDDMPLALKACDLIICSAGAITITEINAIGKPSILIPKAYTAENHQEYNAMAMQKRGAAVVIKENDLTGEVLYKNIGEILNNKNKLETMERCSRNISKKSASDLIYNEIIGLIKNK